jgi:phage terminase large subunit-like protein
MLSNTATPKYYGAFREKVLRGEIVVCREVAMEMNRIDGLIANPGVYYDDKAVEGFIRFCETELTLPDGSDMYLMESFKIWAEQIFCWYYYVERDVYVPGKNGEEGHYVRKRIRKRLTTKQVLIVGRSASKSTYVADIQAYFLTADTSTTHQVTVAPTMAQANEVMSPIKTAIARARGPLFKFLTEGSLQNTTGSKAKRVKLASTKAGIQNFLTGSLLEVRPMSIDKLQGLKTKVNSVDEWLSGDVREDVLTALEQGAAKIDGYLILAVSSEGTVRNGIGDTMKIELMDILKGDYYNPHVSIWWYKLDDIKEVNDPRMWIKANPNLGISVQYETYQQEVEKALRVPAAHNDIMAKRFGIPMEGLTYYFTFEEIQLHPKRDYWGMPCAMGMDLSRGDDFCAFLFLFPLKDGTFGVKALCYITEVTLTKLHASLRRKYNEFINEGTLRIMQTPVLDMMMVYDDVIRFIRDHDYDVRTVGYDPYNAKAFIETWVSEYGEYALEKVIQGRRTESVPLGELKILAEQRALRFDEEIMGYSMGNAIALVDINGNRMLAKKRNDEKIDPVAAMMDAYIAWKLHREDF